MIRLPARILCLAALVTTGCQSDPPPDWRPVRVGGAPQQPSDSAEFIATMKDVRNGLHDAAHNRNTLRGTDWDSPAGRALRSGQGP